jgi:hypothetical protein
MICQNSDRREFNMVNLLKLNASPAGGASIITTVKVHLTKYGPSGVPKGRVDAQKRGQGRTPCLRLPNLATGFPAYQHYLKLRPTFRILG